MAPNQILPKGTAMALPGYREGLQVVSHFFAGPILFYCLAPDEKAAVYYVVASEALEAPEPSRAPAQPRKESRHGPTTQPKPRRRFQSSRPPRA